MVAEKQHIDKTLIPILEQVSDPEIPVLSIMDMGVVRSAIIENNIVKVQITPTYSGCPAMDVIGDDIDIAITENSSSSGSDKTMYLNRGGADANNCYRYRSASHITLMEVAG